MHRRTNENGRISSLRIVQRTTYCFINIGGADPTSDVVRLHVAGARTQIEMPTFPLVFFLHQVPCVITITMMLRARMYKAVKKNLQEKTSMQLFGRASFMASIKSRTTVGIDLSNATGRRTISLHGFLLKK